MIPARYNLRNLRVRWMTTLMTVVGTGLVVWATVLTFGLKDGLEYALRISGHPLELIVLRKGSNDETGSIIDQQLAREVATLDGIERDEAGHILCSTEYVTILTKPRRGDGGTTNLIVRGLDENGRRLRPDFRIVEGRDLKPGLNEAITSRNMAQRFENLAIGEKLEINRVDFQIVGYFEAGGSAAESELWAARGDVTGARRHAGAVSSVRLRAQDEAARDAIKNRLENDDQFNLKAIEETKYYEEQMSASAAIKYIGYVIGGFLTFGAMFAAANTMYDAVEFRASDIVSLIALWFGV
jgi:putative ABC transport system permease protein